MLFGGEFIRRADDELLNSQRFRRVHHGIQRIVGGHDQGGNVLARLFGQLDDGRHQFAVVAVELGDVGGCVADGDDLGRHHDHVSGFRIGFFQRPLQHVQVLWRANGHEFAVGFGRVQSLGRNLGRTSFGELLDVFVGRSLVVAMCHFLGDEKNAHQNGRESQSADGGHFFGKQVDQRRRAQHAKDEQEPHRHLERTDSKVERHLEFADAFVFEPQHEHRQGIEEKAPDHAEGVRLA